MKATLVSLLLVLPLLVGAALPQDKKKKGDDARKAKAQAIEQKKADHKQIKEWVQSKRPKDKKAAEEIKLYDILRDHGFSPAKAKTYVKKAIDHGLGMKRLQIRVKRSGEGGIRGKVLEDAIESEMKEQIKEKKAKEAEGKGKSKKPSGKGGKGK